MVSNLYKILIAVALAYILYRILSRKKFTKLDKKYEEVVNSDKYKVKGQYG